MTIFGQGFVNNALITCRTSNNFAVPGTRSWERAWINWGQVALQWYDTGQFHIVTNVTFRSCNTRSVQTIKTWELMTHSDQFVPESMQATARVRYENCSESTRIGMSVTNVETVSGRYQNWLDVDGSASGRGVPTIIGSTVARDWWRLDDRCGLNATWRTWLCDKTPTRSIGSLSVDFSPEQSNVGGRNCSNGSGMPCRQIGWATHMGYTNLSRAMALTLNRELTGPTGGFGWYLGWIAGTPRTLTINDVQADPNDTLIVVLQYPPGTRVNVTMRTSSTCSGSCTPARGCLCRVAFRPVGSYAAFRAGAGDTYYFDGQYLHFRVTQQRSNNIGQGGAWGVGYTTGFIRQNISIPYKNYGGGVLQVDSDCTPTSADGLMCGVANVVPPAPCPAGTPQVRRHIPPLQQTPHSPSPTPRAQVGFDTCGSPTPTASATPTGTPTSTSTPSGTGTGSATGTPTVSPSFGASPSSTASSSPAPSPSASLSRSPSPSSAAAAINATVRMRPAVLLTPAQRASMRAAVATLLPATANATLRVVEVRLVALGWLNVTASNGAASPAVWIGGLTDGDRARVAAAIAAGLQLGAGDAVSVTVTAVGSGRSMQAGGAAAPAAALVSFAVTPADQSSTAGVAAIAARVVAPSTSSATAAGVVAALTTGGAPVASAAVASSDTGVETVFGVAEQAHAAALAGSAADGTLSTSLTSAGVVTGGMVVDGAVAVALPPGGGAGGDGSGTTASPGLSPALVGGAAAGAAAVAVIVAAAWYGMSRRRNGGAAPGPFKSSVTPLPAGYSDDATLKGTVNPATLAASRTGVGASVMSRIGVSGRTVEFAPSPTGQSPRRDAGAVATSVALYMSADAKAAAGAGGVGGADGGSDQRRSWNGRNPAGSGRDLTQQRKR